MTTMIHGVEIATLLLVTGIFITGGIHIYQRWLVLRGKLYLQQPC